MSKTERPRVVHVVPALFGWENVFGGGERYALELARAMARRVPTRLIAFGSRPKRLERDGLEVRVLRNWANFRRFRFDPVAPALWRHLRGADVIHVHQPETMMASQALAYARLTGTPIYSTHLGGAGLGLHRLTDVTGWYAGHLHISAFSRQVFGHEHLPTARVVGGGVDTEAYCPDPSLPRDGGVVYVGRILPHKGINYLIEAMDPDIPLTIVGRRWRHAQAFGALLERLAEGKDVRFIEGRTHEPGTWAVDDNAEIIDACRRALCIVLPSVHETVDGDYYAIPELLGLVLLEGMACGAPAIVSNVCSLPEVVRDGVTGFVVPPNDPSALRAKIRFLRDHPEAARRMGEAARRDVLERFTWDQVAERCLEAYGHGPAAASPDAGAEPRSGRRRLDRTSRLRDRLGPAGQLRYLAWRAGVLGGDLRVRLDTGERLVLRRPPAEDLHAAYEVFCTDTYAWPAGWAPATARTVVDLGANVGLATLRLAERFPEAAIDAFEPHPAHLRQLRTLVAANGLEARVTIHPQAVGAVAGRLHLTDAAMRSALTEQAGPGTFPVEVVDWLAWAQGRRIDVLKMDVEGTELAIVGDQRFAALDVGSVVLEWHAPPERPDAREVVLGGLEAAGFTARPGVEVEQGGGRYGMIWASRRWAG